MRCRSISEPDGDIEELLEADRQVYPTSNPVRTDVVRRWYRRNPEFGMFFECRKGHRAGMCIVIPLSPLAWNALVAGKCTEADLDCDSVFDINRDMAIGLHFYHLEKRSDVPPGFHRTAFSAISSAIQGLRRTNSRLAIHGLSALCVSADGIALFERRLGFKEGRFKSKEYILRRNGDITLATDQTKASLARLESEGYEIVNRCKMLVLRPGSPNPVWDQM